MVVLKTKKAKIQALHCQLDFRRKVILQGYKDKTVFQLLQKGKAFAPDELARNLCLLLGAQSSQTNTRSRCLASDEHSGIASELPKPSNTFGR